MYQYTTRCEPLYFQKMRLKSRDTYVNKCLGSITQEALKMSGRGWSISPGFRDFSLRPPVS